MFNELIKINTKPKPFEFYTAESIWKDEYLSEQMLFNHLNKEIILVSKNVDFIQKSTNWIFNKFNISKDSSVCEFGCGVGLFTRAFAKTGAKVTGIDYSKNYLNYAKEVAWNKNLKINYVHQNYLNYNNDEEFDLIVMIMNNFCMLSPDQRSILLNKFYRLLSKKGNILLNVKSLNAFDKRIENSSYEWNQLNKFWSKNDYYAFVNTYKYHDEKVTLDKYSIIEKEKLKAVYNWIQYYNLETIKKEFARADLVVKEVYRNIAGEDYNDSDDEFTIVVKKA